VLVFDVFVPLEELPETTAEHMEEANAGLGVADAEVGAHM